MHESRIGDRNSEIGLLVYSPEPNNTDVAELFLPFSASVFRGTIERIIQEVSITSAMRQSEAIRLVSTESCLRIMEICLG